MIKKYNNFLNENNIIPNNIIDTFYERIKRLIDSHKDKNHPLIKKELDRLESINGNIPKKIQELLNESIRDKMTPVSKDVLLAKISDNFIKTLMDVNEFNAQEAEKWILENIDKIMKLSVTYSADKVIDKLSDITDLVKRKFKLEDGGIVDNGWNKPNSVIINRGNIKEIYDFIKDKCPWTLGGDFNDIIKTWDIIDKMYKVKSVKLSVSGFSRDKTFDGRFKTYLAFTFDVGQNNNPSLVFNANSTKTPYIWIRLSNTGWVDISLEESDLQNKIKSYLKW